MGASQEKENVKVRKCMFEKPWMLPPETFSFIC
jgi:hypothetical protein